MSKLNPNKITDADVNEFLQKEHNDFQLEITCLREMESRGFIVAHGGTYEDPVTKKSRQYDLRASRVHELTEGVVLKVRLAVECKFLSDNFPLLVSCLPRAQHESTHDVVFSFRNRLKGQMSWEPNATRITIKESVYRINEQVGKSTTQIGRHVREDEWVTGDSEAFEKWAQAIASAHDLVSEATGDYRREGVDHCFTFILPVLVITDGTLWIANYSHDGQLMSNPHLAQECDIFIAKEVSTGGRGIDYSFSNLKVFTRSGFVEFLDKLGANDDYWELLFPKDTTLRLVLQTPEQ